MKKLTTSWLWTSFLPVLMISPALAQPTKQVVPAALKPDNVVTSITASPLRITAKEKAAVSAAKVSAQVLRSFDQSFRGAENAFWTTGNNNAAAEFKMEGRQAVALFNKDGRLVHTILYGPGKHLPDVERSAIRYEYPDYEIISTQEITTSHSHLWLAVLQDDRQIIRVGVANGEVHELNRYRRSQ